LLQLKQLKGELIFMLINGIEVTINGFADMKEEEILGYIRCVENETDEALLSLAISDAGKGDVALTINSTLINSNAFAASLAISLEQRIVGTMQNALKNTTA